MAKTNSTTKEGKDRRAFQEQERLRSEQVKELWTEIIEHWTKIAQCFQESKGRITHAATGETVVILKMALTCLKQASATLIKKTDLRLVR